MGAPMRRSRKLTLAAAAAAALVAQLLIAAVPAVAHAAATPAHDSVITQLEHLPGVTYLGTDTGAPSGYRLFQLEIEQPVDHNDPTGPTFEQHLELYHLNF